MKYLIVVFSFLLTKTTYAQEPGFEYHFRLFDRNIEITNQLKSYKIQSLSLYGKPSHFSDSVRYFDYNNYGPLLSWHLLQPYGYIRNFVWLQIVRNAIQKDTLNILYEKWGKYSLTNDNYDRKIDSIVFHPGNFFVSLWGEHGTPTFEEWNKLSGIRINKIHEAMFDFIDRNFGKK